jgi:hypothetical protein
MNRRLLSLATAVVTFGALVVTSGAATAATAAAPAGADSATAIGDITAYAVDFGPDGEYVYDSHFVPADGTAVGAATPDGGVSIQGSDPATYTASTTFHPPTGTTFAPGEYAVGLGPTDATVELAHGQNGQCVDTAPNGTLVVHAVSHDAGLVTSFAASARLTCSTGQPIALEMRWKSTLPVTRLVAPVNTASPVRTVTVPVTTATTFGTAALTGLDGASIVSNTCQGTVPANTSCAIGLRATPTTFVPAQGTLSLPDGGAGVQRPVTIVGEETARGAYTSLATPARLLDTRRKLGVATTTPIGSGKYIDLQVTTRGGVPATGPGTVVLNVTAVNPTSQGYLTVYPTGTARPQASSVNFNAHWVGANLVTVRLGTGGKVRIFNASGSTHVVADVLGYYHGSSSTASDPDTYGGFHSVEPLRLLDTRSTELWDGTPLDPWTAVEVPFGFTDPDLSRRIKALAVNVTVTRPTASGYLAAWVGDDTAPTTSTVNFTKGRTVANMAIVPTQVCTFCTADPTARSIGVLNASDGASHVLVDVVGVYFDNSISDAWRLTPLAKPTRIVDSRIGQGLPGNLGAGGVGTVVTPAPVAGFNTMAVVTNTTAAKPTKNTFLTLWPNDDSVLPGVSNLNPNAGQLVSAMTMTQVWAENDFRVYNAAGTTPVVIDVTGTMELYPAQTPITPSAGVKALAPGGTGTTFEPGKALTPARTAGQRFPTR